MDECFLLLFWGQKLGSKAAKSYSDPKSCCDRKLFTFGMSLQPCHPSFPGRQPISGGFAQTFMHWTAWARVVVPQGQHKSFRCQKAASLCSVPAPLLVRKAESMMLTWGSFRCCGTLQIDSLVLFGSQSTVVWLTVAGTPVNHLLNIDLPWLQRQKLNIRPKNAAGIDFLAHELLVIFTGPWRPKKYYTMPCKPNIKWNFCFCSWCGLYSFHPASSWEYFNAKKNLLCSLKKALFGNIYETSGKWFPRNHLLDTAQFRLLPHSC